MAESERLNLSTDGDDVCRVLVSGPAGVKGAHLCVCFCLCVCVCVKQKADMTEVSCRRYIKCLRQEELSDWLASYPIE